MGISLRHLGELRILLGDPLAANSSDGPEPQGLNWLRRVGERRVGEERLAWPWT